MLQLFNEVMPECEPRQRTLVRIRFELDPVPYFFSRRFLFCNPCLLRLSSRIQTHLWASRDSDVKPVLYMWHWLTRLDRRPVRHGSCLLSAFVAGAARKPLKGRRARGSVGGFLFFAGWLCSLFRAGTHSLQGLSRLGWNNSSEIKHSFAFRWRCFGVRLLLGLLRSLLLSGLSRLLWVIR